MTSHLTPEKALKLYQELGVLAKAIPDLSSDRMGDAYGWLASVQAIMEEALGVMYPDVTAFSVASEYRSNPVTNKQNQATLMMTLHRTLSRLERIAPDAATSSFIGAGEKFTALATLNRVISEAASHLLFVDPYAAANILTDYAISALEGVRVHILASKRQVSDGLLPAVEAWKAQYGDSRPIEVRVAQRGKIHDRAIFIDDSMAWTMGTSFNGVGGNSPTILQRVDGEVFTDKHAAYRAIWEASDVLL